MSLRGTARDVLDGYDEHDVLTYASAIAFKIAFALIPLGLVVLGVAGVFNLDETWTASAAPTLRHQLSPAAFTVLDQTVRQVLGRAQWFWATAGVLLTIWEVSGATRAVMGVLDRIYEIRQERPFLARMAVSVGLAALTVVLVVVAVGLLQFGPGLVDDLLGRSTVVGIVAAVARWALALAALAALLAIIVRYAPSERRSWQLVTRGGLLTLGGWVVTSLLFVVYLRDLAEYGSLFGNLATLIIALEYLYLSSIVLLTGLLVDRLQNEGMDGGRARA